MTSKRSSIQASIRAALGAHLLTAAVISGAVVACSGANETPKSNVVAANAELQALGIAAFEVAPSAPDATRRLSFFAAGGEVLGSLTFEGQARDLAKVDLTWEQSAWTFETRPGQSLSITTDGQTALLTFAGPEVHADPESLALFTASSDALTLMDRLLHASNFLNSTPASTAPGESDSSVSALSGCGHSYTVYYQGISQSYACTLAQADVNSYCLMLIGSCCGTSVCSCKQLSPSNYECKASAFVL